MPYFYTWKEPQVVMRISFGIKTLPGGLPQDDYIDWPRRNQFIAWLEKERIPQRYLSNFEDFLFSTQNAEKVKKWLIEHDIGDCGSLQI